jgi:hypothetical protein
VEQFRALTRARAEKGVPVDRPSMHIAFEPQPVAPKRRRLQIIPTLKSAARGSYRLFTCDLLRHPLGRIEGDGRGGRILRRIFYRTLCLPVVVILFSAAIVFSGTHPPATFDSSGQNPSSYGLYFETPEIVTDDYTVLSAWVLPKLDARRVLDDGEKSLTERCPAVLLVPDFTQPKQQLLPLAIALHKAGYIVMVIGTRGTESSSLVGVTFGLRESNDVRAALTALRKTPFVDSRRIAVFGLGTGATASLLAAQRDPTINALILDRPWHSFDEVLHQHFSPTKSWLHFMDPFCQWTFEIGYGVNASDVNLTHSMGQLQSRPVMRFDAADFTGLHPRSSACILNFLHKAMPPATTD